MKNLYILFLAVVLFSCGSDKEDPTPIPEPEPPLESTSKLVGKWDVTSTQTQMSVDGKSYKEFLMEYGLSEEDAEIFNQMLEDQLTLTGFYADLDFKADYKWTGNSEFAEAPVKGTWKLTADEKTLTLTNDAEVGKTEVATITKLTDTELWMEMDPKIETQPVGAPGKVTYLAIIKCKRKI